MKSKAPLISLISILLLASGLFAFQKWRGTPETRALSHRELATKILAEYLAEHFNGQQALVISNPFTRTKESKPQALEFEQAGIRGLQTGFGKRVQMKIAYPDLRPEFLRSPSSVPVDPKSTTPLSFLVAEGAFDQLAEQSSECRLLVSLIGLPVNLHRLKVWQPSSEKKFALLLPDWRMIGNLEQIRAAFKSGKIAAAVMNKPGAPGENEKIERADKAAFESRFFLATAESIDRLLKEYPQLF